MSGAAGSAAGGRVRRVFAAGFVSGTGLLLASCAAPSSGIPSSEVPGSGGPASVAPAAANPPEAGVRELRAMQRDLRSRAAVEVRGWTRDQPRTGRSQARADLGTGDFATTVPLGAGGGEVTLRRVGDLTWTIAPPAFWVGLGYTEASADAARGRWVRARTADIGALVAAFDPGATVRAVLALDGSAIEPGSRPGWWRVSDPGSHVRALRIGPGHRLSEVWLRSGRDVVVLRIVGFPRHLEIAVPPAERVLRAAAVPGEEEQ